MITLLQGAEAQANAKTVDATANANVTTTTTEQPASGADQQEQQAQPQAGGYGFWIMILAMIAIMYFFMWRPEKKRRKEMQQFRDGLKSGDKVITAGGIYAVVKKVEETSLLIEVDSNVTLRIDKNMVVAAPEK